GGVVLLSGRLPALVVAGVGRRQLPADHVADAGADDLGRRGELRAPVSDRAPARAEGAAVVRRSRRVLGWTEARRLDGERPGVDAVAFDVRVQRPARDD